MKFSRLKQVHYSTFRNFYSYTNVTLFACPFSSVKLKYTSLGNLLKSPRPVLFIGHYQTSRGLLFVGCFVRITEKNVYKMVTGTLWLLLSDKLKTNMYIYITYCLKSIFICFKMVGTVCL